MGPPDKNISIFIFIFLIFLANAPPLSFCKMAEISLLRDALSHLDDLFLIVIVVCGEFNGLTCLN